MNEVLAFDPGKVIGYAHFENGEFQSSIELQSLEEIVKQFQCVLNSPLTVEERNLVCITETFSRGNTAVKDQLQTIEIIGAIRALCLVHEVPLIEQLPSMRTGYIPIAKAMIRENGYTLKEKHHSIDAIAHGLAYMDKGGVEWHKRYWMSKAFQQGA